jgi:hypothetical protein
LVLYNSKYRLLRFDSCGFKQSLTAWAGEGTRLERIVILGAADFPLLGPWFDIASIISTFGEKEACFSYAPAAAKVVLAKIASRVTGSYKAHVDKG